MGRFRPPWLALLGVLTPALLVWGQTAANPRSGADNLAPDLDVQILRPFEHAGGEPAWLAEVENRGRGFRAPAMTEWRDGAGRVLERFASDGFAAGERRSFLLMPPPTSTLDAVSFRIEAPATAGDACAANNVRAERRQAWGVRVVAHRAVAEFIGAARNGVGSRSFPDWLQLHLETLNDLFARAEREHIEGAEIGRVRLDEVALIDDGAPLPPWTGDEARVRWDLHRRMVEVVEPDPTPPADWRLSEDHARAWTGRYARRPELLHSLDWALLHEFGHGLGLIDLYPFAVFAEELPAAFGFSRSAPDRTPVFPYDTRSLMGHEYARGLSRFHALALRRWGGPSRGRPSEDRYGGYLLDLPEQMRLELVDDRGRTLKSGRLEIFRAVLRPQSGYYGRMFDAEPEASFALGSGSVVLGRGMFGAEFLKPPHPFVRPALGVLLLRWVDGAQRRYGALQAPTALLAHWSGQDRVTVPMTVVP